MPDTPAKSPEKKALDYVEGLGLNSVYDEARASRMAMDQLQLDLLSERAGKRALEARRLDVEMELAERERAANPDLSLAAFERHLKVILHDDDTLRTIRGELLDTASRIDTLEQQIDLHATDIKIAVARLHELGGYFQFMAVIKGASEARKAEQQREEGNPW